MKTNAQIATDILANITKSKTVSPVKLTALLTDMNDNKPNVSEMVTKLETHNTVASLQAYTASSTAQLDGSDWVKKTGNKTSNGGSFAGTIVRVDGSNYWERAYTISPSPMWFGAKVNDTNFDNSTALQLMFDNFDNVILDIGNYYVKKTVYIKRSNFNLAGAGKFATAIRACSDFDRINYTCLLSVGTSSIFPYNNVISDLWVTATDSNNGNNLSGIEIYSDFNIDFINVWTQGGNIISRDCAGITMYKSKHTRFLHCNFTNSYGYGIAIKGANYGETSFSNCSFDENQCDFLITGNIENLFIDNCKFGWVVDNSYAPAPEQKRSIIIKSTASITFLKIQNNDFIIPISTTQKNVIVLDGNISRCVIKDNFFSNVRRQAIVKSSGLPVTITGNHFENCGQDQTSSDYLSATTNFETTPFVADIQILSGYYANVIANNTSSRAIIAVVEPLANDLAYLNSKYENNLVYSVSKLWGKSKKSTVSISSDGTLVSYNIPHGLGYAPKYYSVQANSADASNIKYVTANATNIIVTYNTAPPSGSSNLVFSFSAEL